MGTGRSFFSLRNLLIGGACAIGLGAAFVAGAVVHKYRAQLRALVQSVQGSALIQANLHTLSVQKLRIATGGRDGGIAAVGDGILLASRAGEFWFVDSAKVLHPLAVRAPVNITEFLSDKSIEGLIFPENFGLKDIHVMERDGNARVLVSHNHWHAAQHCYTLRVSRLDVPVLQLTATESGTAGEWRTIYETAPCYALSDMPGGGSPHPTIGAGGRIAALNDRDVLLTVGGFKGENEILESDFYWDSTSSYGKTILLDAESGASRPFTIGHRNPQGLLVTPDSQIWATEHLARGGDELNRLRDGTNYGYPKVSYGTAYGSMTWPGGARQGRHDGFTKPAFSWVPSLGISQLIRLEGDRFPYWKGDLVIATLGTQALFRVRLDGERVEFVEPIPIGHRVRDIIESPDGSIVLKTDDDFLIFLAPVSTDVATLGGFEPAVRGEILASGCLGCHAVVAGEPARIGPNLHGVFERDIAGVPGFNYSPALRAIDGRWTDESLKGFLRDPAAFAPGTSMQLPRPFRESQLDDLVAYLRTLR